MRVRTKLRPNRYLNRIARLTGESDSLRAVASFVRRFREPGDTLSSMAIGLGIAEILEQPMSFPGGVFEDHGRLVIRLNSQNSVRRRRFTLAHEIGHLLFWKILKVEHRSCGEKVLENACNIVATEILMPAEEIRAFDKYLGSASVENLRLVAERFDVSLQAAARRLHEDLGLWKSAVGLWQWDDGAKEKWFVGRKRWGNDLPSFAAFDKAREDSGVVRTRELFHGRLCAETTSLEVLNIGNNRLLGLVG